MAKTIQLGQRLRYPVTIVKILKSAGDSVKKQEPLLQYSFKWKVSVGDHVRGDTWEETQTTVASWDSPADGKLLQWHIKEGEVIGADRPCLVVEEACSHEVQFQGLCAICGKDMTEVNWASEARDTERAPINMTHDQTSLTVSELQAQRAEQELQRRLLAQRKLSLVVDLDQTVIHACIEPTIGEWQRDPSNPNYDSVKEVRSFQLNDDGPRGLATGYWYYIKMRPGLEEFLTKVADKYELHVYTMGTRAYAQNIAKIVDPHQKLFGNRVISRDENGSMIAKSLQRLFPVSTNMVVIIDDRADVWPRNRPNLIKVTPYDFFKGIGDINSSFLPRREDLLAAPPPPAIKPASPVAAQRAKQNGTNEAAKADKISALEELASMAGGGDEILTRKQIEEQERALEKQIMDRPLLHLQEKLDKEDEEADKTSDTETGDEPSASPPHQRHHLLLDDDHELPYLERHLTRLHEAYYGEFEKNGEANGAPIPDVGQVLDALKADVLRGTKIVLSGLVPIGVDVKRSEIGLQVISFGAELRERITQDVTHLVISGTRPRTQKVRQAARIPSIKIVNQDWLGECLTQWTRVDETPYLVDIHPADRGHQPLVPSSAPGTLDAEILSDADDDSEDNAVQPRTPLRIKPRGLWIGSQIGRAEDEHESDEEDNADDLDASEEGLLPSELAEGQLSPVDGLKTFNWGEADEELDEFLASGTDDDDDDDDNGASSSQETESNEGGEDLQDGSLKRKHEGSGEEETPNSDNALGGSAGNLAKKQRLAKSRPSSSLRAEYHADGDSSLPTPQITGDEDDVSLIKVATQNSQVDALENETFEIDEDDLEADLMAEFEAEERHMRAAEGEKEKG